MTPGQAKSQAKTAFTQSNPPQTQPGNRIQRGISLWRYSTKKGQKWAFEVRFLEHGMIQKVQRRGFQTKSEAVAAAGSWNTGEGAGSTSRPRDIRFGELVSLYVAHLQGTINETSRANYFHLVSLYCRETIFSRYITSLGYSDFHQLFQSLARPPRNLRPGTINTLRSRLIAVFNYGIQIGACQVNPVKLVKPQKAAAQGASQVSEPWSVAEANHARTVFEGTSLELFLDLALFLGLRKGEILALTWSDIDLDLGLIRINKSYSQRRTLVEGRVVTSESNGETKTASSVRSLPVPAILLDKLRVLEASCDFEKGSPVVGRNGKHWSISNLGKEYRRICHSGKVRFIRIHDIRHTSAVLSLLGEAPLEAVSQGLGHTGVDVTKRFYAKRVSSFPGLFTSGIEKALGEKS